MNLDRARDALHYARIVLSNRRPSTESVYEALQRIQLALEPDRIYDPEDPWHSRTIPNPKLAKQPARQQKQGVGRDPQQTPGVFMKSPQTRHFNVEVLCEKPIPDLVDFIAGRVWTIDGVKCDDLKAVTVTEVSARVDIDMDAVVSVALQSKAETSPDQNVEAIRKKLLDRSRVGLAKYGVTTERKDLDLAQWLVHAQEEAMDFAVYLQAQMERAAAHERLRKLLCNYNPAYPMGAGMYAQFKELMEQLDVREDGGRD